MSPHIASECTSWNWSDVFQIGKFNQRMGGYFAGFGRWEDRLGRSYAIALVLSEMDLGDFSELKWGGYGTWMFGAESRSDGFSNTAVMLNAGCEAARVTRRLSLHGHVDWYLPSLSEMSIAASNVPELFRPDEDYWTSTQENKNMAFVCNVRSGYTVTYRKDVAKNVRAMRRVSLASFIEQSGLIVGA